MTTYSAQERLAEIQRQGFANPLTALAVSLAEFGPNRDINAQGQSDVPNPNGPNGKENSWGPWQIFLDAHPDVTRSCALDLACSTAAAHKISNGGTNFNPWSAFTNGSYLAEVKNITSTLKLPTPSATATPSPSSGGAGGGSPAPAVPPCNLSPQQTGSAISLAGGGLDYKEIAARIGAEPRCIAELFGQELPNIPTQVGTAAANAVGGLSNSKWTDLLKSENLWRAGFVIVGAALIYFGARLYLKPSGEIREAVPNA